MNLKCFAYWMEFIHIKNNWYYEFRVYLKETGPSGTKKLSKMPAGNFCTSPETFLIKANHSSHGNFQVFSISKFFWPYLSIMQILFPFVALVITYIFKNSAIKICMFDSLYVEIFRFVAWLEIFAHIWA